MMSVLSRLLLLACVLSTSVAALKSRNVFDVTLNIAAPLPPLNITGGAFLGEFNVLTRLLDLAVSVCMFGVRY